MEPLRQTELEQLRNRVAELEQRLGSGPANGCRTEALRALDVLDSISDAVTELDWEWCVRYANAPAVAMSRMPKERLVGSCFWDLFPELLALPGYGHLQRAMRERVHAHYEEYYAPFDLWVEVNAYPVTDGLVMVVHDISDRKRAEQLLRAKEEQIRRQFDELEQIYHAAPVGLAVLDAEFRFQRINRRLAALNGVSVEEHLGRSLEEVIPEAAPAITAFCLKVLRTGLPVLDRELRLKTRADGGRAHFYRCSYYPVRDGGETSGVSAVIEDVTAQKESEAALRLSEERLQLAIEALQIGTFDWDMDTGRVLWSDEEYVLFGVAPGEFDGTVAAWASHVLPEDFEGVRAATAACIAAREPTISVEFRIRRPDGEVRWIRRHGRVLYTPEGRAYRMVGVNIDTTADRLAQEALQQSEQRYRTLFETTSDGILIVDDDGCYVDVNESYCRILKAPKERVIGAHFSEFIPAGRLHEAEESFARLRAGGSRTPVDFPLRALDGSIVELAWSAASNYLPGLHFSTCRDITDRKRAEEALRRNERELRFVLNHVPVLIAYIDTSFHYIRVNRGYEDFLAAPASEIQGKHMRDILGTERFEKLGGYLDRVLAGESVTFEWSMKKPGGTEHHLAVSYTPDRDESGEVRGFIALTQDITERKRNEDALRAREEESRRLLAALPDVISRFDRDLRILYKSPAVEHFTGQEPESMFGKTQQEAGFSEELSLKLDECLRSVFASGQPQTVEFDYESPTLGPRHIIRRCFPEADAGGVVRSVLTIGRDVTEQRRSEDERGLLLAREHEARETAEVLNEVGPILAAELDPQRLGQAVTDIASRLIGAEFRAFFRNPASIQSGSDAPGTPTEAFAGFPTAVDTELFAPTFRGEAMVRADDLLRDPRYANCAPFPGLAPEHPPVRSYLAAPVISRSGEVLGGLFFGHGAAGRFTGRHEAIVAGVAAQAAIAMDNARLFEQSRWVQNELKRANQELRRANADLETFAYSASHDLQEPLRNVAICAQLLQRSTGSSLGAEETQFLDGILQGALRMQALVQDLLSYMRATRFAEGAPPEIDAARVLAGVVESMKTLIEQNAATVDAGELPTISIHEIHLAQLFQNLVGNALKYRSKEAPSIHVSAIRQQGWWVFSVGDNGIGIDPQYADQIFTLFKRLHTRSEYPGSGIGLAICQRIVEQYGGRIWLERSAPGEGSVFSFSIPER